MIIQHLCEYSFMSESETSFHLALHYNWYPFKKNTIAIISQGFLAVLLSLEIWDLLTICCALKVRVKEEEEEESDREGGSRAESVSLRRSRSWSRGAHIRWLCVVEMQLQGETEQHCATGFVLTLSHSWWCRVDTPVLTYGELCTYFTYALQI